MWESLGFVIAFAYSTFICLSIKLYILLAMLILTMITYLMVEYHHHKNPVSSESITLNTITEKEKDTYKEGDNSETDQNVALNMKSPAF